MAKFSSTFLTITVLVSVSREQPSLLTLSALTARDQDSSQDVGNGFQRPFLPSRHHLNPLKPPSPPPTILTILSMDHSVEGTTFFPAWGSGIPLVMDLPHGIYLLLCEANVSHSWAILIHTILGAYPQDWLSPYFEFWQPSFPAAWQSRFSPTMTFLLEMQLVIDI